MQANHHQTGTTRVKVYHGRRHTKKPPQSEVSKQPVKSKKAIWQKGRVGRTLRSKIIHTHYTYSEKPSQFCGKRQSQRNQIFNSASKKQGNKLAVSKASPFGGDLEGAKGGPNP